MTSGARSSKISAMDTLIDRVPDEVAKLRQLVADQQSLIAVIAQQREHDAIELQRRAEHFTSTIHQHELGLPRFHGQF